MKAQCYGAKHRKLLFEINKFSLKCSTKEKKKILLSCFHSQINFSFVSLTVKVEAFGVFTL